MTVTPTRSRSGAADPPHLTVTLEDGRRPDPPRPSSRSGGPGNLGPAPGPLPAPLPAWPLTSMLAFYPVWWALGLGVLIFPIMAAVMAWMLLRRRLTTGVRVALPPGFAWWALFLLVVVVSIGALGETPAGTVDSPFSGRLIAVAFRLAEYVALTLIMVYVGNLTERQLSRRRLVRLLGWLFAVTVAGGALGMLAGTFQFASPVELLLPAHLRDQSFVASLVHPMAAQMMDVLGHASPRPAAPWGYTNTWGNNYCLLVVWFVAAAWGWRSKHRPAALLLLAASVLPVVHSLNRGLWVGLGVSAAYMAFRLAVRGRAWIVGLLGTVVVAGLIVLMASPLGTVVSQRLEHGKSNGVRTYLTAQAITGVSRSPVIGFGSTRNTEGGRNSIAIGESNDCPHCGNFTIGGNGQLWQVLYAHGIAGTIAYFGFFGYGLWRFRRDRSAIGLAGSTALVGSFSSALWYNSLVTPMAFMLIAYALLWRNDIALRERDGSELRATRNELRATRNEVTR